MRPPSEVVPRVLFVGRARPLAELRAAGMVAVVNLARREYDGDRIHIPLHDGPNDAAALDDVVAAVHELAMHPSDCPVYLHCAAGHSRSPTVAALYVLRHYQQALLGEELSFTAALAYVKARHRSTRPNDRITAAAQAVAQLWGYGP